MVGQPPRRVKDEKLTAEQGFGFFRDGAAWATLAVHISRNEALCLMHPEMGE
jgi:hypothetical protein